MKKNKLIKTMKYEIIKPIDIEDKIFYQILYDLQYDSIKLKNKIIQKCFEWYGFSSDYKKKYEEYPNIKEHLDYKKLSGYIYNDIKEQYPKFNSGNYSTSIDVTVESWDSNYIDILKAETSIPVYKKINAIDLHDKSIQIKEFNKRVAIMQLSLISNSYKKELGLKKGNFNILLVIENDTRFEILKRCQDKTYKICASKIIKNKRKNKWMLALTYSFEKEVNHTIDPNRIMGIDMGIVKPVYMAFNDIDSRYCIEGGEIEQFRKGINARRNSMLKQGKYCGKGRRGHGRKTLLKPTEKLRGKIENFKDTANHKYSKYVVDMAIKHNCGTIQMEDLTDIASGEKKATFLGDWTYYNLQSKIEYKAKQKGINVVKVSPKYTSQRCSKCGHISKENRDAKKDQSKFECVSCGFKTNADFNASKNISTLNIDNIIREQLKKQEK